MAVSGETLKKDGLNYMRAAVYEPGGPEGLHIGNVQVPELKSKQVLIKAYASAVNRADTLQRQGKYPPPPGESEIIGLEVAGVIEKRDSECTKWQEGDRVMALLGGGGYAEYVAVHEDLVIPVPKGMELKVAASIPETWLTAYQLLHFVGHVKAGDKVLIHAAGSGVGLAAIQLAKAAQAEVYATAGSQSKLDMAQLQGATKGFNYKVGSFAEGVLTATQGHGVDLILDCVGGSFWKQNAEVISLDGRWVLYGTLGGGRVEGEFISAILRKRISFLGTTLRTRPLEYKIRLVQDFTQHVIPLFENGKVKTIIDKEFSLGRVSEAHKYMEEDKNIGKIVLIIRQDGK